MTFDPPSWLLGGLLSCGDKRTFDSGKHGVRKMLPSEALVGLPALVIGGDDSIWEDCDHGLERTAGLSTGAGRSLGGWTMACLVDGSAEGFDS